MVPSLLVAGSAPSIVLSSRPEHVSFPTSHCLDCHDGARAKGGGVDLTGIMAAGESDRDGGAPGRGQPGAGAATTEGHAADAWMTAADPTLLRALRARFTR